MREERVLVRRRRREGERREEIGFPLGWEVVHITGEPPRQSLADTELPPPRSIPLPPGRVVVVVNDAQRPTPTPWLMGLLACDWRRPDVRIAVATGCHAPPTATELREIFGPRLAEIRERIHIHRAAVDPFFSPGTTSRGTPVEVSRCLEEAEVVVGLGSVEPHYFAGWTGGRKSLVPGLCSLATMRSNHRLALEAGAAVGVLAGNPLHLDLQEAAGMLGDRLRRQGAAAPIGINVVVARGHVHAWQRGPLLAMVEALAPCGREIFGRRISGRFPLVVCLVDHPLDRDLYQALKALEHWKSAVASGGILILVADCPAGIGPPTFGQFTKRDVTLETLLRRVASDYRLGDHKLVNYLRYVGSGRQAWLVASRLAGRTDLPLRIFRDLSEAFAAAGSFLDPATRKALIVEDAATIFPLLTQDADGEISP